MKGSAKSEDNLISTCSVKLFGYNFNVLFDMASYLTSSQFSAPLIGKNWSMRYTKKQIKPYKFPALLV